MKVNKLFAIFIYSILIFSLTFTGCKKEEKVIKIGAIVPLTGPASSFGQYVKEGIDLAIEEINAVSPTKFLIIYEDSKNQPKEAISSYKKLTTVEKVPVIIAVLSSIASALSPFASKDRIPQIYVDVVKPGVADGIYTFRIYPEASATAGKLAEFATLFLKAKRAAIIYINDDYGIASLKVFTKKFQGGIVFIESYEMIQKDFRSLITKLKGVKPIPDVIYLNGYGPAFVKVLKQLREFGVKTQVIADVALGLPENLELAGNAAEGVYFVDSPMSLDFINKFKQKYGKQPSSDAGYAYDVIKILYTVVKEKKEFNPSSIREVFASLLDFGGVMGKITMKENGDANLEFVINQVKNGIPILINFK